MDKSNKSKKVKKWCKPRHKFFRWFINTLLTPYFKLLYHLKVRKFKDNKRQFVILFNHQTPLDQFIITKVFKNPIYFIASEDLRLRGPGDLFGIRQSGDMTFKIGDIYQDADCLKEANEAANRLNGEDRKQIMTDLCQNGANGIFLFLDAYSTI